VSNEIPTATREAIRKRDDGRCIICGAPATEIMHRVRRREGGHELSNLALGCRHCHATCHNQPAWARSKGFILSAVADVDTTREPLWSWRGWVLLTEAGRFEVIAPRTAQKPQVRR
jgi:hypothetical protein